MNTKTFTASFVLMLATAALLLTSQAQQLRKGVSVQMAVTHNASPVPEADEEDAWVVTVAADGKLFFGADPMTPEELTEWMKSHPRNREANLYVKADARASFDSVEQVLEIARAMGFEAPVLLTAQAEHNAPGTMVPPKGLPVLVDAPTEANSIVVRIGHGQNSSTLSVNHQEISAEALQRTLAELVQNSGDHLVIVKSDRGVPFRDLAYVVDLCHSVGAKAALSTAQL